MSIGGGNAGIGRLLQGAETFRREVFESERALFEKLARGQSPHTLFIACADSRVSPGLITQTKPGEMFVLRNIGNIVPRHGDMLGGVSAAVEYAVSALGVTDIVVCGHTDCGAMKALEDPAGNRVDEMPTVRSWLTNAAPALAAARAIEAEGHRHDTLRLLVEQNVLLQIANLRTHPSVANAVAAGRLFVHGWVYDIEHGEIAVTDEATGGTETIEAAKARLGL
jgi:carbonic anhydrase